MITHHKLENKEVELGRALAEAERRIHDLEAALERLVRISARVAVPFSYVWHGIYPELVQSIEMAHAALRRDQ